MSMRGLLDGISIPSLPDLSSPKREIEMSAGDEAQVFESLSALEEAHIDTDSLFSLFDDFQSKRTLTTKRLFLSFSMVVVAATWIQVDYSEMAFLGLKVATGSPWRFILFLALTIIVTGAFFEFSRRIDAAVQNAKLLHISADLQELRAVVEQLEEIMRRYGVESFGRLASDFKPPSAVGGPSPELAFNAIRFFYQNLSRARSGQGLLGIAELVAVYGVAFFAVMSLTVALWNA